MIDVKPLEFLLVCKALGCAGLVPLTVLADDHRFQISDLMELKNVW